jgi:tyrosyl-tRNA synthetase
MCRYFTLLTDCATDKIEEYKRASELGSMHPMELKKKLAHMIVSRFWSITDADLGQEQFEHLFQEKKYDVAKEFVIEQLEIKPVWIVDLLKNIGAVTSSSDAKRLIDAKAVSIDGNLVTDFKAMIVCQNNMIVKSGKHCIVSLKIKH